MTSTSTQPSSPSRWAMSDGKGREKIEGAHWWGPFVIEGQHTRRPTFNQTGYTYACYGCERMI